MRARKCDRCNNFYDEYDGHDTGNSIQTLNIFSCGKYGLDHNLVPKTLYDLCPSCMTSLTNWLDMIMTEVKK